MPLTMSISTTAPALGRQIELLQHFAQASMPALPDHAEALSAWNEVRRDVMAPSGMATDAFGPFPTSRAAIPAFAANVVSSLRGRFGARLEELAEKGEVSRAACRQHGISPEMLTRYGVRGLLPTAAVEAFHASAATYLERQLNTAGIRLGGVLQAAVESLSANEPWAAPPRRLEELFAFLAAAGVPSEAIFRRPTGPDGEARRRARIQRDVGEVIEESLRLLIAYGRRNTAPFFRKHRLEVGVIQRALMHGLISEQAAKELYTVITSAEHSSKSNRRIIRIMGAGGLAGVGLLWFEYLARFDSILLARLREHPQASVPMAFGTLVFILMTYYPALFERD